MTNLSISNKSFTRLLAGLRRIMPYLAGVLLFVVYAVSAAAAGLFLARLLAGITGGVVLAFVIGIAIQATRGTLVFFPQLNPSRPILGHAGEVIAVTMGLISIAEIIALVGAAGLAYPVAVSLSVLMLAGIGVELFLLREVRFATEMQLFSNRAYWQELRDFYTARKEFATFIDELRDTTPATSAKRSAPASAPARSAEVAEEDVFFDLGEQSNGRH